MNKFEKMAGMFVLVALLGTLAAFMGVAFKKGWFESRVLFYSLLESGDGIRTGTALEMSGLRVGTVKDIYLDDSGLVRVDLSIYQKYQNRIKSDTRVQVVRPFVIGEKSLSLTQGTPSAPVLPPASLLETEEVFSLTDILNGRKHGPYMDTITRSMDALKLIVDTMLENDGAIKIVKLLEALYPALDQVSRMSREMTKLSRQMSEKNRMGLIVRNLADVSEEMRKLLPTISGSAPGLGKDMALLVSNLAVISEEFKKVLPALSTVAPELPRTSQRLVVAIDEAVVVLKALQKSFLLRGSAREVREEEELEKERKPSSKKVE